MAYWGTEGICTGLEGSEPRDQSSDGSQEAEKKERSSRPSWGAR